MQRFLRQLTNTWHLTLLALLISLLILTPGAPGPVSAAGGSAWINYTFTPDFPQDWRAPTESCLNRVVESQPGGVEYIVGAFRVSGGQDWMTVSAAPRSVVDAGWSADDAGGQVADLLIHHEAGVDFPCTEVGFQADMNLLRQVPVDFADYSFFTSPRLGAINGLQYRFPWKDGISWKLEQSWHLYWDNKSVPNALDFSPPTTNPTENSAILSAESGFISVECADPEQFLLKITHSDANWTGYLHIAASSIPPNIIEKNKTVGRGDFLGLAYNGTNKDYYREKISQYQFSTKCGYGFGSHLHFTVSNRDMEFQGTKMTDVAKQIGTWFKSSNESSNDNPPAESCTGGEGVVVYAGKNFTGTCLRLNANVSDFGTTAMGRNNIESLKVIGNYEIALYNDAGYTGDSSRFTTDDKNLDDNTIRNNRASAAKVSRRDAGGSSNCADSGPGVYLFDQKNYTGNCQKVTGEISDLNKAYIKENTVSSILISGSNKVQIYSKKRFEGNKTSLTHSDPDLSDNTVGNDTASSVKVTALAENSSNCDSGDGVFLYDEKNYAGRCSKFTSDSALSKGWYVGNDSTESVMIKGSFEAELCQNDNFGGKCSRFSQSDSDLSDNNVKANSASSLRVYPVSASSQPANCEANQFYGEYFANPGLSGAPVYRRCDNKIDFSWWFGSPASGIPADNFSARWTGDFLIGANGSYWISAATDDGVRVWVDNQLIINSWRDKASNSVGVYRYLSTGSHTIRMEYYEHGGLALAKLTWGLNHLSDGLSESLREMDFGDAFNGTITTPGEVQDYYFNGSAGQTITIRMEQAESNLDSFVALYDQDEKLIGQADDYQGNHDAFISVKLPTNGIYRIAARGYGSSTGEYRILLEHESLADSDDNRWIAMNEPVDARLATNDDRDSYYLSVVKDRFVVLGLDAADLGLDAVMELYDAGGSLVAQNDDGSGGRSPLLVYQAAQTEVYRLVVRSYNLASSGAYTLRMNPAENMGGNLAKGKPAQASAFTATTSGPAAALDGNLQTAWEPPAGSHHLYVEVGSAVFDQVILKWGDRFPSSYGLVAWDGSQWKTIAWTDSADGGTDVIPLASEVSGPVGVYIPESANPGGLSLREVEIYNSSKVLIPLVPPDPIDKVIELVPTYVPPAPAENGKSIVMVGSGSQAQETSPLLTLAQPMTLTAPSIGVPTAVLIYPSSDNHRYGPKDQITLQADGLDSDATDIITAFEWRSDRQGWLSGQGIASIDPADLMEGSHQIAVRVCDDEGLWSEWVYTSIEVTHTFPIYLPAVMR